jgi:flavodoxin
MTRQEQMRTLIVYDSQYGNTAVIARAVGAAIPGEVTLQRAGEGPRPVLSDLDLIIVGSPTQGGRPTLAVASFLTSIAPVDHIAAAAFDTRVAPKGPLRLLLGLVGYAAPRIGRQLRARGAQVVLEPEGFIVEGKEGPLRDGEEQRAAAWAKELLASISNIQRSGPSARTPEL